MKMIKLIKNENNFSKIISLPRKGKRKFLVIPNKESLFVLKIKDIYFCKADGNYTMIFSKKHPPILICKTLKKLQEAIPSKNFIRPHQSFLINLKYVLEVGKKLTLSNGSSIPISRSRKENLLKRVLQKGCIV